MAVSRRAFLSAVAGGAGAAAVLPALAACGPAQGTGQSAAPAVKFGEPVTVTFWHSQTSGNATALDELVTKFNQTNGKNITIKSEYQGSYTQIFQKAMAAIQAGQTPDTLVAYESMVAEYMKANYVVDLDDYALKGPQALSKEDLADIFPQYLEANKYDGFNGKLLSYPFTKSLAVNYYNEDLFKAAGLSKFSGLTFDEFKKAVSAMTKKDGAKTAVFGTHITNDTSYIDAFIYANGGALLNNDKSKVRFNEDPGVQMFDMWGQMAKDGQGYTSSGYDFQADFGANKVAQVQQSSTSWTFMRDEVSKAAKAKWGIGLIPQKDTAKPVTVMFGGNITVLKAPKGKELQPAGAWEWIKFFTNKENTVTWAIKSSYMPLRKSAADNADLKALWASNPQSKQAFDLTPYAKPEPNITAWQDIRTILQDALTAVTTGKQTAKQALDEAAKQANKLIDEKR
jgi:ABC-type glycerol-3-phosphate transport system substrate-binding protein